MFKSIYPRSIFVALVMVLASISRLEAQQPKPPVDQAPVPVQILLAKRIFISNAGGESNLAGYSGNADRTYNQFYAALKNVGRFEIVPAPAGADLVFEIGFAGAINAKVLPADPHFTLVIRDPKSNVLLWRFNQYVGGNRDKNFDQAMSNLFG